MNPQLAEVVEAAPGKLAAVDSLEELDRVEAELLGRRSVLARLQKEIGSLPPEERPALGRDLQQARATLVELVETRRRALEREMADRVATADRVDVTLDAFRLPLGSRHLIYQTIEEVCEIFVSLGYVVAEGPEAEIAWYNFDALNTPPTHPARAETDTLYIDFGDPATEPLLRTHTSPMQIRWMEAHRPPVAVVVPGKVYRADTIDASHLPVFHQVEGLMVGEDVRFSDLKGTLAHFARSFFGPQTQVRFRPSFFPFTEPSAELDVSCFACRGGEPGCRVCGGEGWLELLGCGMVDPNVFDAVGYDPKSVTGFAFGMGVERLAMVRHSIDDIRLFVDNDLRFLRQFP